MNTNYNICIHTILHKYVGTSDIFVDFMHCWELSQSTILIYFLFFRKLFLHNIIQPKYQSFKHYIQLFGEFWRYIWIIGILQGIQKENFGYLSKISTLLTLWFNSILCFEPTSMNKKSFSHAFTLILSFWRFEDNLRQQIRDKIMLYDLEIGKINE